MNKQTTTITLDTVADFVRTELQARADPGKAGPMAAYMKTEMPFYGVQKAGREQIARILKQQFIPADTTEYEVAIIALWSLPHREEKYLAIHLARLYPRFITVEVLALYERLIREGAWWDFVDDIAIRLVGKVLLQHRQTIAPIMDRWIDDPDLWIRRSAIIAQIGHQQATDQSRLFRYCLQCAAEREFFIRKAIGWTLRDYSYTAPEPILNFLRENKGKLSRLSFREGAKGLRRLGYEV